MTRRLDSFVQRATTLLAGGLLLQAGGCSIDFNAAAQELVTTVANNLIASVVFGAFNIQLTGGF